MFFFIIILALIFAIGWFLMWTVIVIWLFYWFFTDGLKYLRGLENDLEKKTHRKSNLHRKEAKA